MANASWEAQDGGRAAGHPVHVPRRRKWPAGYAVIVLTLALGIGINTMFFTFFNGMVLRPLPFVDPDRLVTLNESQPALQQTQGAVSAANLRDWQEQNTVFGAIAPFVQLTFDLHSNDDPERVRGAAISAALAPAFAAETVDA